MHSCMLPSANVPGPIRQRSRPQAGNQSNIRRMRNLARDWREFSLPNENSLRIQRDRGLRSHLDLANQEKDAPGDLGTSAGGSLSVRPQSRGHGGGQNRAILVPAGVSRGHASSGPRQFPRRSGPPICGPLPFLLRPAFAAWQIPSRVPRKAVRHAPARSFSPRIPLR